MNKLERLERKRRRDEWKARRAKLPFKRHRGLGFRLMLHFITFGLIMGVLVYVSTAIVDMRSLIRDLGGLIAEKSHSVSGVEKIPKKLPKSGDEKLHDDLTLFQKKFPSSKTGFEIFLYVNKNGSGWMEMVSGSGTEMEQRTADPLVARRLDKAAASKDQADGMRGEGFSEGTFVIPSKDKTTIYGARIVIHQKAIAERIKNDRDLLFGYTALLVLFGFLLGSFFARQITGPLGELTEAAYRFAQGDTKYRNRVRMRNELGFLGNTLNYMAEKVESHIQDIEYKTRTMEAMNRIDKTVLGHLFDPEVVDRVAEIVAGFLGSGSVALAMPDPRSRVYRISAYQGGVATEDSFASGSVSFDALPEGGASVSRRGFEEFRLDQGDALPAELRPFFKMPAGTLIHAPLTGSTGYQGSCFVLDSDKKGFSNSEKEAIRMLADQVGVAIQNARVYKEKENLLIEILLSLTRAIDAKSKWTGGHSGRVSAYAVEIGTQAGLDAADLESLKMSGHLHDIGKLATPEAILDKPGKLTDEEYDIIKKHPEDGARIVGPVDPDKRFVPGILHHHERWDGKGYPSGLSGEAIPLQARILCVADVWDAISAERPYRAGMPREKALLFMQENRGIIFDPVLLDHFLEVQSKKQSK